MKRTSTFNDEVDDVYYSLFKNTTIGLYQTTPDGKILSANPAIIKMLNFDSLEDLLSRDLTKGSYVDERKRTVFVSILEKEGVISNYESEWYTKDGQILYVREGARAVRDKNGKVYRYDGAVEDITELKKTEMKLRKAMQKAEENDKLKSAFLANISHEIRTPLNGILGFSELLLQPDLTHEKRVEYIVTILKSGDRLLNTVNDVVDISKIESGQMSFSVSSINIKELFLELRTFFSHQCDEKGISLEIECKCKGDDIILSADKTKLNSILTNLIKNALKFTDEGGIFIGCKQKNGSVEFFVRDTGIGIPKDKCERIFNRFEQVDILMTKKYEGSGLGLPISKAYVEMHGGKIWLESEQNVGTTFYFTIPI